MVDRTKPPHHSSSFTLDFPKVETRVFDNAVNTFILSAGSQPVVKLEALFPYGGNYYEEVTATSLLALQMLREGTRSYSSAEIANILAQYGAFLEISPSFDVPSVSLYCLSRHVDALLPYFKEMLTCPVFPDSEFDTLKNIQIQNLKAQKKKTSVTASKKFRHLLYGDHPYGKQITEALLKALTLNEIRSFYKSNLNHFELLISGQVEPSTLESITANFGDLKQEKISFSPRQSIKPLTIEEEVRQPDSAALQCSIRLGRLIVPKAHKDYIPILVTNHILGGYFGSRLMKNIREDKGYTYGIHSSIISFKSSAYLSISSDVVKEHVEDAVNEVKKELQHLTDDPVPEKELATVKSHILGSFQSQLSSPFTLMSKFKEVHIHDLDYSYYDQYLSGVRDISADVIKHTAQAYFRPENMKQVIIG